MSHPVLDAIGTRRVTRVMTDRAIERPLLEEVLKAGRWAPNGGNRETMNPVYQRLIGPSAEIWEIDDARHIKGLQTHPEEYERRVVGFFDRALLDDSPEKGA